MAFAAIETARGEFGLEVGRDVSIVGFDDAGLAAWPSFSLTTFSQPIDAMAARVSDITRKLLADPAAKPTHEIVKGELVVRGSARLPKSGLVSEAGQTVWRP